MNKIVKSFIDKVNAEGITGAINERERDKLVLLLLSEIVSAGNVVELTSKGETISVKLNELSSAITGSVESTVTELLKHVSGLEGVKAEERKEFLTILSKVYNTINQGLSALASKALPTNYATENTLVDIKQSLDKRSAVEVTKLPLAENAATEKGIQAVYTSLEAFRKALLEKNFVIDDAATNSGLKDIEKAVRDIKFDITFPEQQKGLATAANQELLNQELQRVVQSNENTVTMFSAFVDDVLRRLAAVVDANAATIVQLTESFQFAVSEIKEARKQDSVLPIPTKVFNRSSIEGVNQWLVTGTGSVVEGYVISNSNPSQVAYVKLYNVTETNFVGKHTPIVKIAIPAGGSVSLGGAEIPFNAGIGVGITARIEDADQSKVSSGDVAVTLWYK